jgi:hypothetical protein
LTSKSDGEDDEAEIDRDEDDMDVAGNGTTEDVNLNVNLKEPAESESDGRDSSEGSKISREAETSTAGPQMAKRKQRCIAAISHRQLLYIRCVLPVLTIYTFRMKPKRIEWYKWRPNWVIDEFDNAQKESEFRVKMGSSRVLCTVLEAEDDDGWYVLVQRGDNKKVAKISIQKFRQSIPKRLEHLKEKFDEWLADPATDKSDFVEENFFEYLSDTRAQRKTGEKPLPSADILHLKREKENKTTKQKIGPPAATVIVTSSGITAREPQQNPVLVFSITLTQKRVRSPVWIILVLHAELASVRALLVKGLYHSNLPSTLELVCDEHSLLHAHTQTKFRKCKCKFSRTHIDVDTCTRHLQSLDDDVLRHILQHHIWVCLIIPVQEKKQVSRGSWPWTG